VHRNEQLEKALKTEDDEPEELYSAELLEFAVDNIPFIRKLESKLEEILRVKRKITFLAPMGARYRYAVHDLVTIHYSMESMSYDLEPNRSIVVYYKPEARMPAVTLSSVASKIKMGLTKGPERRPIGATLLFY
jgi:hypothetical protein